MNGSKKTESQTHVYLEPKLENQSVLSTSQLREGNSCKTSWNFSCGATALYAEQYSGVSIVQSSHTLRIRRQRRSVPAVKGLQPFSYEKENHEACTKVCRDLYHEVLPI